MRDNHASYRVPGAAELPARLHGVLTAIYLIYTEGHTATTGDRLNRVDLSSEALRLAGVVVDLMPDEPEAVGLLALLMLTDARRPGRVEGDGTVVRLAEQDRNRWNRLLITEGHDLVRQCLQRNQPGPFQIQAAIAAVHADAATADETDWSQIVTLYDHLFALQPTAVVGLNRAVAIAEASGPAAGLAALAELDRAALAEYQPYHAALADLLARTDDSTALDAYDEAIARTGNLAERRFLENQRAKVAARQSE